MHNAALYSRYNEMQRRDVKETIDKYWYKLQWRKDGKDSVLDVGCGTGDVAHDYVWPQLPTNYSRYVGVDTSSEMVEWARKNYSNPKVRYEKYDIGFQMDKQAYKHEPYEHVVSWWCLNWVKDQKLAHQNLYKLLKPGGDMLIGFLAQNPIYDIYKEMAKDPKWSKYMSDVDYYVSPYQYSQNPAEDYKKLLQSTGYKNVWCETWDKSYTWEGCNALKNAWTAVNPWYGNIPDSEQEAYWNCFLDYCVKKGYCLDDWKANPQTARFKDSYKWMVAYAQK